MANDITAIKNQVLAIHWHHQIDLGNGIVTPGQDNSLKKLKRLKLPASLKGKTVLDIGSWDGFFAFEAEDRQAARVLATDSFIWNGGVKGVDKRGFDLAKKLLNSAVEEQTIDILDVSPDKVGEFDLVLFLGVLYHMKHPLLALEKMASVTKEMAVIETVVDLLWIKKPAMAFYVDDELNQDATNWVGPNLPALVGMLKTVGFKRIEVVAGTRSLLFRLLKAIFYKYKKGHSFWSTLQSDRVVIHAYK
jgi:tRNA (mo5U34)-methyltransferase